MWITTRVAPGPAGGGRKAGEGSHPSGGRQRVGLGAAVAFEGRMGWDRVVGLRRVRLCARAADTRWCGCAAALQETAPFLRVLGSYPMDTELGTMSNDDPAMMQTMSRYN